MTDIDKVILRLAQEVRYKQVCTATIDPRTNQKPYDLANIDLQSAEHMLVAAIQTADGDHGDMDYYGDWAERFLAETPDAIGMTDMASGTPRKGGSWREYRPA